VKNTGTAPLQLQTGNCGYDVNPCTEGSYSADYTFATNSCGINTIPIGGTCTFSVEFTPSTTNQEVGTVSVYGNTGNGPLSVTLTGHGTAGQATVSPAGLSFFTKSVGTTSAARTVTVKNTGTVPLQFETGNCGYDVNPCTEGSYSGDYSISDNSCGINTIAVGTTCTFSVDFTPSTSNEETGSINIYDNAANSPQSISLTGLATSATVTVSTASLTFPASGAAPVGLGETSPAQTVTVTNTGKVPVQMGFASPSGDDPSISSTYANDFAITSNSCAGNTIPAGTTCTFSLTFTPSTLNDEIGTLTIYDNAIGGPQTISLSGQGTAAQASLSTGALTFTAPAVGDTSAPQKVTVTNDGTVPLQMGYGTTSKTNPVVTGSYSGDFTILDNSCADYTIAVGTTCTFEVEFTPSTSNEETGTLDIYGNTATNPQQITLQGTIASGGLRHHRAP
jgi:hypothetical protein